MPTSNFKDRYDEIATVSSVAGIVLALQDYSKEPNTKRFVRSREQRQTRWAQLAILAADQAKRLADPEAVTRRKPRVVGVVEKRPIATPEIVANDATT